MVLYEFCHSCYNSKIIVACFFFTQELVMDILRVLSSPDLEVRKKTLQLVLDLVTSRNIHEVWERLQYKPDP